MNKYISIITTVISLLVLTCNSVFASLPRPSQYSTRYEFYDSIIEAKANQRTSRNTVNGTATVGGTRDKLEEIDSYMDFKNIINEVKVDTIMVVAGDISIWYNSKVEGKVYNLMIVWYKDTDTIDYMEKYRNRISSNPITEIKYGKKAILKQEVYLQGYGHTINQYWWVENGEAVQVNVSPELLDLYPEETFFDIHQVPISLFDLPPRIKLNNWILEFDTPPVIDNGRTFVPMRDFFEAAGADVAWDEDTFTATVSQNEQTVSFIIGEETAQVNDNSVIMDVPARLINGRTMVPLRFLGEELGYDVEWDEEKNMAIINSK